MSDAQGEGRQGGPPTARALGAARRLLGSPWTQSLILTAVCGAVFVLAHTRLARPLGLEWLARRWGLLLLVVLALVSVGWTRGRVAEGRTLTARRRRLRRAFRGLVTIGVWALGVLLGEVYLRASGRYLTWTERNGAGYVSPYDAAGVALPFTLGPSRRFMMTQPEFSHEVVTNALGLRDDELPQEKPAEEYRVVALGDSFTMSQGADFEDTWTRVLERDLARVERSRRVRVLCAGVPGSDPVFALHLLERALLPLRPDLVLLVMNGSDLTDVMVRGGFERFQPDGVLRYRDGPRWEPLFARSQLVRHVVFDYGRFDYLLLDADVRAAREAEAAEVLVDAGRRLQALGQAAGFQAAVVLHPLLQEVHPGPAGPGGLWRHGVGRRLAALGLPVWDVLPDLRERIEPDSLEEWYWPIDTHFTPRGYRLLAEAVKTRLSAVPGFPGPSE